MSNRKQKTAVVLTGAVALASGAYALGSQSDGSAEAAGDRPAHFRGGPPGAGFGLDRLADRLGVDADELREALEDVRGDLPPLHERRDDFAEQLADELGTTKAKVDAALERIRERHADEASERRDALAEALAERLNLDASEVEDALEAPRLFRRPGP